MDDKQDLNESRKLKYQSIANVYSPRPDYDSARVSVDRGYLSNENEKNKFNNTVKSEQ